MTQFYERDRAWGIQVQPLGFLPPNVPDRVWGPPPPWWSRVRPLALILGLIAWGVVTALVVLLAFLQPAARESTAASAAANKLNLYLLRTQARYMLGVRELFAGTPMANDQQMYSQAQAMNTGTVDQRLRFVVLAGEMQGPHEALKQLDHLEELIRQRNAKLTP